MNHFFLKDDYDWSIQALLITEKSDEEVQKIINNIRFLDNEVRDDYNYNEVERVLKENGITVIHRQSIKSVSY